MTTKTVGDLTENYTYDALNRLKTVGYSDDRVSEEYFYDELGNRSLKNMGDKQEVYTYNDVNQLIRLSAPAGVTTYTYDRRGNLTEETLNSETTTYTYNGFDQLLEVRNNQGYQVNRFDAEGNRNNVLYNGREQNKLYLGQQVLSELNNKGQEKAFYIRGTTLLSTNQNVKGEGYYLSTSRGDILSVLDELGQTLNSYTYDAFGKTLNQLEEIYNPYKYAGYEQDRLKTDYYLNARTYRPDIGRFLQEDNYRGDGLNLYAYVANNPLIYVDPSGYCKQGINGIKAGDETVIRALNGELFDARYLDIGGTLVAMPYDLEGFGNASKTQVTHEMLDAAAMADGGAPSYADGLDAINALWYLGEGDLGNAGLSAGAILIDPLTGGRVAAKAGEFAKKADNVLEWTNHGFKHFASKNLPWKDVVKSTKNGPAKYLHGTDIEKLERMVWDKGTDVTNGKTWKVMEFDEVIGATAGKETKYIRVELSSGTIHGHPITKAEYNKLLK